MTSRRTLKHDIKLICTDLFVECIAVTLYGTPSEKEDAEALMHTIVKMESNYVSRISHQEPGLPAKLYYRDLKRKFKANVTEIISQLNITE